ncbi:MAG: hypothetical protein ACOCZS_03035 [Verrucomicrobiota bacterium]
MSGCRGNDPISKSDYQSRFKATLKLMAAIAVVLVCAAVNRLLASDFLRSQVLDVLRLCDIIVVFILTPGLVLLTHRLLVITSSSDRSKGKSEWLLFVIGVYLLGVGFGMHEPMNVLSTFSVKQESLRRSIQFFDDGLGHWVFFAGFMLLVLAIVRGETKNPLPESFQWIGNVTVGITGISVGTVIFINMYREDTLVDLIVLGLTLLVSLAFWLQSKNRNWQRLPMTAAIVLAFFLGIAGTLLYWWFANVLA